MSDRSAEHSGIAKSPVQNSDGRPLVLGLGGTTREGSLSERVLRSALRHAEQHGARTEILCASELDIPMYAPGRSERDLRARRLVRAVSAADGVVISSPGYHGGISGLIKNALDYIEDLREDAHPYLEGRAVGCVVCASGWQATTATLVSLRSVVHALRGWPTPLGVTVNSSVTSVDGADDGEHPHPELRAMTGQVVEFANARAPRSAPQGRPHNRAAHG